MKNISSLIKDIVKAPEATQNVFFGTVTEVDLKSRTCSVNPNNSTAPVAGVRLVGQSDDGDEVRQGMVLIPRVGSVVMIVMESDTEGFVGLYSQVETVEWMIESKDVSSSVNWTSEGENVAILSSEKVGDEAKNSTSTKTSVEGIDQVIKADTDNTVIDIVATGINKEITSSSNTTTIGITANGISQVSGDTEVNFEDDGVIIKNTESLKDILNEMVSEMAAIMVPTGVGPSGIPQNSIQIEMISDKINTLFKG